MRCFAAWLGLVGGCNGATDDEESNTDDTDVAADTDVDTDVDTDIETDATSDTDTTPVAYDVCASGAPFATIQEAVDAATDGDVITICPGVYEPVEIVQVDVELHGDSRDTTVIDGGDSYAAVRIE